MYCADGAANVDVEPSSGSPCDERVEVTVHAEPALIKVNVCISVLLAVGVGVTEPTNLIV